MFLTSLTSSPHFYTFLYISVFFLAAFNICGILVLLLHKHRLENIEARMEVLKRRITTAIIDVTDPAEVLSAPLSHTDYEAYSEAASSIIENFEGEIAERAEQLIYKFKVPDYFRTLCRNHVWFKRAHAVDTLARLKLKKNREFFLAIFRSETSAEVKYRIIYGLSLLASNREHLLSIAGLLSSLPYLTAKYTEDVFFNTIISLRNCGHQEEFDFFLEAIRTDRSIPAKVKHDCLSACHVAGYEESARVIKEYYGTFTDEPEIVIACIKVLAGMGDLTLLPEALQNKDWRIKLTALKYAHLCKPDIQPNDRTLLHDPAYHFSVLPDILKNKDWKTRLAALKQAHLGNSEVLQKLRPMLHDANYHIRINAALALSRMGVRGMEILRDETTSPDKFASDVSRYVLGGSRSAS